MDNMGTTRILVVGKMGQSLSLPYFMVTIEKLAMQLHNFHS